MRVIRIHLLGTIKAVHGQESLWGADADIGEALREECSLPFLWHPCGLCQIQRQAGKTALT